MRAEQALTYFVRRRDAMQLMEEDAAIWALEKQIPKKPIKDDNKMGKFVVNEDMFGKTRTSRPAEKGEKE